MNKITKFVRSRLAQVFLVVELVINGPVIFNAWSPNAEQLAWVHSLPVALIILITMAPTPQK